MILESLQFLSKASLQATLTPFKHTGQLITTSYTIVKTTKEKTYCLIKTILNTRESYGYLNSKIYESKNYACEIINNDIPIHILNITGILIGHSLLLSYIPMPISTLHALTIILISKVLNPPCSTKIPIKNLSSIFSLILKEIMNGMIKHFISYNIYFFFYSMICLYSINLLITLPILIFSYIIKSQFLTVDRNNYEPTTPSTFSSSSSPILY